MNGVQCYKADANMGLVPNGAFHPLGVTQTTPPIGPHGALSQVMFSEAGSKLIVSFKGRYWNWSVFIALVLSYVFSNTAPSAEPGAPNGTPSSFGSTEFSASPGKTRPVIVFPNTWVGGTYELPAT